jgi:sarcosine oxidase
LLQRAYELWESLATDSGRDVITLCGGIYLGQPESLTFAGSLRAAQEWDLPHEVLEADEASRRFPTLRPSQGTLALYERMAGFVRPEETVTAHLELAAAAGAELRFDEPVADWVARPGGEGVRVLTAKGVYTASKLVICPGAWAPELLADLGVPFTVERQVMYWFVPDGGMDAFSPRQHPVYIWEAGDGVQFYGFPGIDGPDGGAKVAFFRKGVVCTPENIDRTVHDDEVEVMRAYVRPRIPALPGPLRHCATCMYTNTPDEHFVIAVHPRHPQVTVACGFSGHGFKFVPVVGEVVADLCINGETRHPIGLFRPDRQFAPVSP